MMNNEVHFVGYETFKIETIVTDLFKNNEKVEYLSDEGEIILKHSPFYAESGGQVADTGYITGDNFKLEVVDVKKRMDNQHIHKVKVLEGIVHLNDKVIAKIDIDRRMSITKNHSVSHVIHQVLNEVLNTNITQAGAKIYDTFLRFDFTYEGEINDDIIIKIEKAVNEKIKNDVPTIIEIMSLEEAKKRGISLTFEDKYGEIVRVVTIYDSVELCAGTHVKNINEIEKFAVISLEPRGANVYRITATTSTNIIPEFEKAIKNYEVEKEKILNKANNIIDEAKALNIEVAYNLETYDKTLTCYEDMLKYRESLRQLQKQVKELEEEFNILKQQKALEDLTSFKTMIEQINDIKVIISQINNYDSKILKPIVDKLMIDYDVKFIFLININNGIISYVARSHDSLIGKINCGDIIKEVAVKTHGSGGGNATFAQGGSKLFDNIDEIIKSVKNLVLVTQ